MAQSSVIFCALFAASCCIFATVSAARTKDLSGYTFIEQPKSKNMSCYQCENYDYNTAADRDMYALRNQLCEDNPGKVIPFKKKCSSEKAQGCAVIRTEYSRYSVLQSSRRIFHIRRFCTDQLLKSCEQTESSRGTITLCTCDNDFCNGSLSNARPLSALALIFAALGALLVSSLR